jgi:uncharacterized membrane protein YgcG
LEHGIIMVRLKQILAIMLAWSFVLVTSPASAQEAPPANLTATQIDALTSPIALYPDALVAQVLAASTYPNEISDAAQWLSANQNLQGQQLMDAVNQQQWDPSVQALTQFPSVLDNMANNLSWTSALGSAYYNQPQDVMNSIQRLRAQAQAAGNLKSNSQVTVVQQAPQTIVIQPTNPQVVYVPTYNPTVVYGTPYYPPGYSTGALVATSLISFGVGVAVGAAISGGCCGWGYNSWGMGWHGGGTVVYNRNVYVSRSNIYAGGNRYYNGSWARPTPYNPNYNRNNYYNNNRVNNVNRNNVNVNNINTNNINTNNVNRNNVNNNNVNRNNVNNNRVSNNVGTTNNVNRPPNNGNLQNRPQNTAARPENTPRGYGQQPSPGTKTGAFSGYGAGGNARTESSRGRQSFGGGGGARGGGGGGGRGGRR